jgi:hypothetical protein
MLDTKPISLHRPCPSCVRNISRKPLLFPVYIYFFYEEHNLPSQYWERGNFQSRHTRLPSVSEFCRHCEGEPQCITFQYYTRSRWNLRWKYDVALWIYTRCCLRWWNVLRKHHLFSYSPIKTYCKMSMKYVQRNAAWSLRCVRNPLSVFFIKGF